MSSNARLLHIKAEPNLFWGKTRGGGVKARGIKARGIE